MHPPVLADQVVGAPHHAQVVAVFGTGAGAAGVAEVVAAQLVLRVEVAEGGLGDEEGGGGGDQGEEEGLGEEGEGL